MYHVYCDESRPEAIGNQNSIDKYAVIGGIWVSKNDVNKAKKEIKKLRDQYNVYGEIKWNNVSPSKMEFYKELVKLFFELGSLRFRCIVIDVIKVDLERYHNSDHELGFYKFYYQLLYHWLDGQEQYSIFVDYKKNKEHTRLTDLKSILNKSSLSEVINLQAVESKQTELIQLTDVLMGAVGYKYNNYETSAAKKSIVELVEEKLGHAIKPTAKIQRKFNVFEIKL
ncbi:DUF3800 domain-containing protein [Chryseomicrobium imtechense]